ncbi:hypothetical protein ALP36_102475 [Pseudomonas syringae pv. coriandricola]|uniref:Uncharacterized protein n=1 Tax=Pseudomonas syringae pv. coriandricola TaxID=264453 RepID=A0A3M4TTH3_9PSED|nr:hypothetical protein ALP87_102404 [Pseudomonas syringae pv. coriandricola]RMU04353.1 hypothetical protein ALP36_102475 [Pseudomonas syringae pv. coriandricola]
MPAPVFEGRDHSGLRNLLSTDRPLTGHCFLTPTQRRDLRYPSQL